MNIGVILIPLFGIFCYILGLTIGMRAARKEYEPIIEDQIAVIKEIQHLRSKNVTSNSN